jgi:hypothetical protein
MLIILDKRKSGKTNRLIKMSADTGYYIVCPTIAEASLIFSKAQKQGLDIPFPISYNEFITRDYYGKGIKGFLIDDADRLLARLTDLPIGAITLTQDGDQ